MLTRPWPGMFRTLYKEPERYVETYWSKYGPDIYVVGDAARRDADGYFWVVGPHRRRDQRLRPPAVDDGGRVGARLARAAWPRRRSCPQPDETTGQAIVAFVTMRGRRRPAGRASTPSCASTSARRSASSRGRSASSGPTTCRRRARARSCAACSKDIAEGHELGDVTTLRDPTVMDALTEKVAARGRRGVMIRHGRVSLR